MNERLHIVWIVYIAQAAFVTANKQKFEQEKKDIL